MDATAFSEGKVCAWTAGSSFSNAVRPSIETRACPSGYKPCKEDQNELIQADELEYITCILNEEPLTSCPITSMEFVKKV
jgi:hypothetical protein